MTRARKRRSPRRARTARGGAGRIEITRAGGCVFATLDRPAARNRLDAAMALRLVELAEEVEDDPDALMLAIRGAGGNFCAGFDHEVGRIAPRVVESIAVLAKPTLAVLDGVVADEGMELALATDLRAAARSARLAFGQLADGRMPHFGGTQRLPRLVGPAQALRMLLTGVAIDGSEAMRIGLVTYVAEGRAGLERLVQQVVRAVTSRGPIAMRLAKEAVRKGHDVTLDQGIRLEEDLYALLQTTADRAEGIRAFLDKRKPLFRGA